MRVAVIGLGAIGLAMSAVGAPSPGVIPPSTELIKLSRQIGYRFGTCVVSRHGDGAAKAILSNADRKTIFAHYGNLLDGHCLKSDTAMMFPYDTFRYSIADALVARDLVKVPVPNLTGVPSLDHIATPVAPPAPKANGSEVDQLRYQYQLASYERARAARLIDIYGECVVRENPGASRNLLTTMPETAQEEGWFAALQPAFASCLPEGQTVEVSKAALRGTIALNYYRLAETALKARPPY